MNLGRPFIPADRTPLVLHIERLRSVPPAARSRWAGASDAIAVGVVWALLGGCVTVMVAVAMAAFAAWLDNGGGM